MITEWFKRLFHLSVGLIYPTERLGSMTYTSLDIMGHWKSIGEVHKFFISFQSLSHVQLFVSPWTAAHQASLSITNSWRLFKLMSIVLLKPSNQLIFCCSLLLPPSIFPSIKVFSNESVFHIRWPKYWSISFSISPSNEHSGLISIRMDWLDLLAVQGTL